uniref:Calmodulin-lysine N-methyltransferase n=1 Tax=Asterionellopsis glacialis TaxID=33640 RepID=A0A7S0PVD6_9STRA
MTEVLCVDNQEGSLFVPDPRLLCPVVKELRCAEELITADDLHTHNQDCEDEDERVGPYTFFVTLPPYSTASESEPEPAIRLALTCRDRSCGVLVPHEPLAPKQLPHEGVDPFFFEKGFYLEAQTGFTVWPGSRLILEALTGSYKGFERMLHWQNRMAKGMLNVLELGAGIGIVGACLAAAGADVLVTDLQVLVDHAIVPNLRRNSHQGVDEKEEKELDNRSSTLTQSLLQSLPETTPVHPIGRGHAAAHVLDWTKSPSSQLPCETLSSIDLIVGCDCAWMEKLIDPVLSTIKVVFAKSIKAGKDPKMLMTYQRRGKNEVFSTLEGFLKEAKIHGWSVECIAWRPVDIEEDGENDVFLFEITPGHELRQSFR